MGDAVSLWSGATEGQVKSVDVAGDVVVAGSYDGHVYLFERGGKLLWKYKVKRRGDKVMGVALSPSGELVAVGTHDGEVYLLDRGRKVRWVFKTEGRFNAAMCVDVLGEGESVAVGCHEGHVYWLDGEGKAVWSHQIGTVFERGYVWEVALASSGHLAAGCHGNEVLLFDKGGKQLWSFKQSKEANAVMSVAISERGEAVLAGSDDKSLTLLNREGRPVWTRALEARVKTVAMDRGGERLAAGTYDGRILVMERRGKVLVEHRLSGGFPWGIALSPRGGQLAVGSSDKSLYVLGLPSIAEADLREAEELLRAARKAGADITVGEGLLAEAQSALKQGDPEGVLVKTGALRATVLDLRAIEDIEERVKGLREKDRSIYLEDVTEAVTRARREFRALLLEDAKNLLTQKEYLHYRRKELADSLAGLEGEAKYSFEAVAGDRDPERFRRLVEERSQKKSLIKEEIREIEKKLYKPIAA